VNETPRAVAPRIAPSLSATHRRFQRALEATAVVCCQPANDARGFPRARGSHARRFQRARKLSSEATYLRVSFEQGLLQTVGGSQVSRRFN